ncbi:hypothetical protein Tco_1216010 [Tanacetum coccineum]
MELLFVLISRGPGHIVWLWAILMKLVRIEVRSGCCYNVQVSRDEERNGCGAVDENKSIWTEGSLLSFFEVRGHFKILIFVLLGGVESSQLALLQTYIEGTLLSNMEDRWVWDLNGEGVFRVKDEVLALVLQLQMATDISPARNAAGGIYHGRPFGSMRLA